MDHQVIASSRFSTHTYAQNRQLLAWRERVGHVIDVLPTLADVENPFRASIDRYQAGELAFTDCRSDKMQLHRSLARISTDNVRNFAFHVFLEGGVENVAVRSTRSEGASSVAGFLAIDLGQPIRMQRNASQVLTFFVPGKLVQEIFPDPESIHGRTIDSATPLTRLILKDVATLAKDIAQMDVATAAAAIRASANLLVAAFGKQAGLTGGARAAARTAMLGQVRRYVQENLYEPALSPESVFATLQLPRSTLYRLFEHEGGLGAYIRELRLRRAADDLARYPRLAVKDVAYALGFKSAPDFTRAFRRAYEMAPQDFRAMVAKRA